MRRVGRGRWVPADREAEPSVADATLEVSRDLTSAPASAADASVADGSVVDGAPVLSSRERRKAKRRAERAAERAAKAVEGSQAPEVRGEEEDEAATETGNAADDVFGASDKSDAGGGVWDDDSDAMGESESDSGKRPAIWSHEESAGDARSPYGSDGDDEDEGVSEAPYAAPRSRDKARAKPSKARPSDRSTPDASPANGREETFVVEGRRAVDAVLEGPLPVRALILVRPDNADAEHEKFSDLEDRAIRRGIEVRRVAPRHAKRYLETRHPQGVAALVARPAAPDLADVFARSRRILVLDGVSDPGNAGTLVRTAWLLGWDAVFATPGSVDLFSEKTVRSSAGAVVHLPLARTKAADLVAAANASGYRILVAEPGSAMSATSDDSPVMLVLGNEARGAESTWPGAHAVGIGMRPGAIDSLGVVASGSILLHHLRRES